MRYSRALPYELHTNAGIEDGIVTLTFGNPGRQGAVFHVYDKAHLDRIPRRYTVEAHKSLDDTWDTRAGDSGGSGGYDLEVFGPNGFLRTFVGNALRPAELDVRLVYDAARRAVSLSVRNTGTTPVSVTVTANAYRARGPWTMKVASGKTVERQWPVAQNGNWYDLTATEAGSGYQRRFAGRLETGKDGVSDPAMATELQQTPAVR